tara:strand:+ start:2900 stop:3355 length:456 start_codon:yes stop_codon:yes gene_type:complete
MTEIDKLLIDSSILLSYKDGDENAKKLIHRAIDGRVSISVSAYSLFVLSKSDSFDRKSEIGFLSLLKFINTINLDAQIAMKTGYIFRSASLGSNMYGQVDLFNMSTSDQNLTEDAVSCAVSELINCPVISVRNNSLENINSEWLILREVSL